MAYQRITLAELRTRLQEKWEDVPFWTDAEATVAINEALREWNCFTGMWKRKVIIPTTTDEHIYALPASINYAMRVAFNGRQLDISSLHDMDNGYPGWQGDEGTPLVWLPISLMTIAIWPKDAVGGNSLEIDGVSDTPQLVGEHDFLDFNDSYLTPFLGECLHNLSFKEGAERWKNTQSLHQAFLIAAIQENARLGASALFRKWAGLNTNRFSRPVRREVENE